VRRPRSVIVVETIRAWMSAGTGTVVVVALVDVLVVGVTTVVRAAEVGSAPPDEQATPTTNNRDEGIHRLDTGANLPSRAA